MLFSRLSSEKGQGLVEYALILVLVAIIVIAILRILGPTVGRVFSRVTTALGYTVVTSVSAERTGSGHGNDVVVTITVSTDTAITVTDSQSGQTNTVSSCGGTCAVTLTGVGDSAGTVTVEAAEGGILSRGYSAKL